MDTGIVGVRVIGVVGAGVIGADLAYVAAGYATKHGGKVVLLDTGQEQLDAAMKRIRGYAGKAVAKGKLTRQAADRLLGTLSTTLNMADLAECDVVFEAVSERVEVKQTVHKAIDGVVRDDCMVCTTTSSIPRARLAENMEHPERFFVWHPYTPAWRSQPVELVGDRKSRYWQMMYDLTIALGKVPIVTADTPCFAGDRVFVAYCLACVWLVQKGIATAAQVNAVANKVIGGGGGLFVLNLTSGNGITVFCADMMRQVHGDWWMPPELLVKQGSTPWDLSGDATCDEATERKIRDTLLAVIIGHAIALVDEGVVSPTDLDWLCRNALGFRFGPVARFNQNPDNVRTVCAEYAQDNPAFVVPESIVKAIPIDFYSNVKVEIGDDGIAVVTVFRPEAMNALNRQTMAELNAAFHALERDERVKGVILTGSTGAIAGADIGELAALTSSEQGVELALSGQAVLNYISAFPKPVVFVANGPCLGGGCELAMACHARVVGPNALMGQPEVNLGIIPGFGGTQGLARLVGFATALELLRTGRTFKAAEAMEIGWAQFSASDDPIDRARNILLKHVAERNPKIHPINPTPMDVPDGTPIVDIGLHSQAIDAILVDVVRRGLAMPLDEGLKLEAEGFGRCFKTQDMRIGLDTFTKYGSKVPAVFVNA